MELEAKKKRMKRYVVLSILLLIIMCVRAQPLTTPKTEVPADSVSIMYRSIQSTNASIVKLNKSYTTHATMVSVGGALQLFGMAMTYYGPSETARDIGMVASVIGIGMIAASIIPMPKGVSIDERGLVLNINETTKKSKK